MTTTKHHHHHHRHLCWLRFQTSFNRSIKRRPLSPPSQSLRWIPTSRLSYARTLSAPSWGGCLLTISPVQPASAASGDRWPQIMRCRFVLSCLLGSFEMSSENLAQASSGGTIPFLNSLSLIVSHVATPSLASLLSTPFRYSHMLNCSSLLLLVGICILVALFLFQFIEFVLLQLNMKWIWIFILEFVKHTLYLWFHRFFL